MILQNSGRFQTLTGVLSFHPDTLNYLSRVVAAGGTVPAANLAALDVAIRSIYADNLRGATNFLKYWLCLNLTDSFTGCLVPVYDDGVGNATNNNFVSGDWSATLGLTGNGTNKNLSSLWNPTTKLGTFSNGGRCDAHVSAWVTALNTTGASGVKGLMGSENDKNDAVIMYTFNNTITGGYITTISAELGVTQSVGLQLLNRVSVSSLRLLTNNSLQDLTSEVASPIVTPDFNIPFFWFGGGATSHSPCSVSNFTMGFGLTPAQETALYTILDTLRIALGA